MGRKKGRCRRPVSATAAGRGSSDEELIRGELCEEEMRDELDEFELSRERTLLAAGGDREGAVTGAGRRGRPPAQLLAFDDDDSDSDVEYQQMTCMGAMDSQETGDDTAVADGDELSGGWGKRKASYYSADCVDEDWRGATREETLEAADLEEREARAIQRRLAEQLQQDELQFGAAAVRPTAETVSAVDAEAIPLDTSGLSRVERLQLLRKQCPELLPLVEEFRTRFTELTAVLEPAAALVRQGRVVAGQGTSYLSGRRRLLLLYCLNISHYLTLRAQRRGLTAAHPVMRRIAQLGRLLQTLAPADQVMAPQLERLCRLQSDAGTDPATVTDGSHPAPAPVEAHRLKVSQRRRPPAGTGTGSAVDQELAALTMEIDSLQREKRRLAAEKEAAGPTFTELRQAGQARHNPLTPFRRNDRAGQYQAGRVEPAPAADGESEPGQKRTITSQMAKNKGLMPKRSRESRNPRVKHKEKFKRAVKKRRSLVRQPKKELSRYGGEVFGIRMGAVKSVSIK